MLVLESVLDGGAPEKLYRSYRRREKEGCGSPTARLQTRDLPRPGCIDGLTEVHSGETRREEERRGEERRGEEKKTHLMRGEWIPSRCRSSQDDWQSSPTLSRGTL